MTSFTFFESYHEMLKYLPDEDAGKMLNAIRFYMFEDVEPQLDGPLMALWIAIKPNLDASKSKSKNKSGKSKHNQTEIKPKSKHNQTEIKQDKSSRLIQKSHPLGEGKGEGKGEEVKPPKPPLGDTLPEKLQEWIDYRKKIKKPIKQPTIAKLLKDYKADPETFALKVDHSIANGYQGLFAPKSSAPPTGSAAPPSPQTFSDCKSALRSFAAAGKNRGWSVEFEGREVKIDDQGRPYDPETVEDLDFEAAGRFYKWLMRNWHLIDGSSGQSSSTADAVSQLAERIRA